MDDMLDRLVALKVDSFADAKTKTGLDKPALVISASYDDGKFERVRFGQVGETTPSALERGERAGKSKRWPGRRDDGDRRRGDATATCRPADKSGEKEVMRAGARALTTATIVAALAVGRPARRRRRHRPRRGRRHPALPGRSAQARHRRHRRRQGVDHAQWSVAARSLRAGDLLYSLNAYRLQVPASNQKLLTTAVAAERLGWDFRYTTRLFATGPVSADGTLDGDLVVVVRTAIPPSTRGTRNAGARSMRGRSNWPRAGSGA